VDNSLAQRVRNADPLIVDTALALALFALTLIEMSTIHCAGVKAGFVVIQGPCASPSDNALTVMFMALGTLQLALRRRYPFSVMNVVGASAIVYDVLDIPPDPYTAIFGILVALYSVAAYARRGLAITSLVILAVAVVVLNLPWIGGTQDFRDVVTNAALLGGAWIVGDNMRSRRRRDELLRERAERAEQEREERAEKAALEERARIAREIHDVVTHSVSVIAVQAGAARTVVQDNPEQALEALQSIERVSRETMAELRRALGVMRDPDGGADMAPQPGLGRLDDLVEQFAGTGLVVEMVITGDARPVPTGVDLAAYRVVQEALTNTLKHAGPTTARVELRFEPELLGVTVTDDGGGGGPPPSPNGDGGGQGIVGMRERVAAYGGTFRAGPGGEGGFVVEAEFPLRGAT